MTGYYLLSGSCASCGTPSTGAAATTASGITGCSTCTSTGILGPSSVYYVTCSACNTGYAYFGTAVPTGTSTITLPWCISYTGTTLTFGSTPSNNTYGANTGSTTTFAIDTNSLMPTFGCTSSLCYAGYSGTAALYFCPDKSTLQVVASAVCTSAGSLTNTGAFTPAGLAATTLGTCTQGTSAVGAAGLWCGKCSSGVLYATSGSTTCITAIAGCAVYGSSTTCTAC